jgi:hypothetical protein
MHRRTWTRLVAECSEAARVENAAFDAWAEHMEGEIEHIARGSLIGLGGK